MSNSKLVACPYCNTLIKGSNKIFNVPDDLLNSIYQCGFCGLIYKPVCNVYSNLDDSSGYHVDSWSINYEIHLARIKKIINYTCKIMPDLCAYPILDVGAGIGLLYDAIKCSSADSTYVAIEPVKSIAEYLSLKFPNIIVLNSDVENSLIPKGVFGSTFVLGVDYLFENIEEAFSIIASSLISGGLIVIERNVFINQTSYVGSFIRSREDIFCSNKLIRNWFYPEQYQHYLTKHFDIIEVFRDDHVINSNGESGKMFTYTYICRKKNIDKGTHIWVPRQFGSLIEEAMSILN